MIRRVVLGALLAIAGAAVASDDPWRYCKAVGTVDVPDGRYLGPAVPERLVTAMRRAFGLADEMTDDRIRAGTSWRCMQGAVWGCEVGANLPCDQKVDLRRAPTFGAQEWCRREPDADSVPMVATGRATAYAWRCRGIRPVAERQVARPDARGFHARIWRRVPEPAR